jgi:subtilisin family serine protease
MSSSNRNIRFNALAGATLLAMGAIAPASAAELLTAERPIEGQYIVVLKKESASLMSEGRGRRPEVAAIAQQMAQSHRADLVKSYKNALRGFVVRADDKALARLLADDRVAYVQEDGMMSISATQSNPVWSLDRIDQRDLPLSQSYTYDNNGSGVHAYIIDTGVRGDHTEFTGRWGNGFNATPDSGGATTDCNGHGTHVAGTVGGTTYGVAKGVTIHPVRVLPCSGSGPNSDVIEGIDWVTSNHIKPAVANMSLGGPADAATDEAVQGMIDAGVIVVVAAGNNNGDACQKSPARVPEAITVGATTPTDRRPDGQDGWNGGSNWGTCLDIFAPGHNIVSAGKASSTATATMSGTSMASPAVAGAAALYLAVNPTSNQAQVATALINNATSGKVTNLGTGSPNKLLYTLFGGGGNPPDNQAPVAGFTKSVSGLTVSFTDSSTDSDGTIASRSWDFGDGTSSTLANPSKTYTAAGTYTVTLTVTDDDGAPNTKTDTVTVTSGGGGGGSCSGTTYTGTLAWGGYAYQPNGTYYQSTVSGAHTGTLTGPTGTDFDLYLVKWNGYAWADVAKSESPTNVENISYNGTAGFYSWRVTSYSGSGSYTLCLTKP